jgi:hypothetical protein
VAVAGRHAPPDRQPYLASTPTTGNVEDDTALSPSGGIAGDHEGLTFP